MINFFQKIRQELLSQNRVGKYLMYAIGEIILVVIGILIALQINNTNENHKKELRIQSYLKEIQRDLSLDILAINVLIDNYIASDSIERKILNNEVAFDTQKDSRSMFLTYFFPDLTIHSNGFQGLMKISDNLPDKYLPLQNDLNNLYITNAKIIDVYNDRISSTVYTNLDDLKGKDWSVQLWQYDNNAAMTSYFLSNTYKNEVMNFMNDYRDHIDIGVDFKFAAIDIYNKIEKLLESNSEIPKHTNIKINDSKMLNQFSGNYKLIKSPLSYDEDEEVAINILDNNLMINNNRLFWHEGGTFLLGSVILNFSNNESGNEVLKINIRGFQEEYIKE